MKNIFISIKAIALFTLFLGMIYPLSMLAIGRLIFPYTSQGSMLKRPLETSTTTQATQDARPLGSVVGSSLIGQSFSQQRYFWPRPSVVQYQAQDSGASNNSLTHKTLK